MLINCSANDQAEYHSESSLQLTPALKKPGTAHQPL